jgi:hypothetical protein
VVVVVSGVRVVVVVPSVDVGCSSEGAVVVGVSGSSSVAWLEHADAASSNASKSAEVRFIGAGYPRPTP